MPKFCLEQLTTPILWLPDRYLVVQQDLESIELFHCFHNFFSFMGYDEYVININDKVFKVFKPIILGCFSKLDIWIS
jgi:hypothetical protein